MENKELKNDMSMEIVHTEIKKFLKETSGSSIMLDSEPKVGTYGLYWNIPLTCWDVSFLDYERQGNPRVIAQYDENKFHDALMKLREVCIYYMI